MKTVCAKDKCTGCMACSDICPKNAIRVDDSVRSYNAIIDEEKCIDCNACHNVCQVNHVGEFRKPISWQQGWAKDENIRSMASSGGLASAIERSFVENGGLVCSCAFTDGEFKFFFAENVDEISKFCGSKYIKSNPSGCYKDVKRKLQEGKRVLFVGLPCQVSAIKNYVGEMFQEKLYTVDLICHGSPSPKILDSFLKQYGISTEKVNDIAFRVKTSFQLRENSKSIGEEGAVDKYSIAFLNAICYTENCYKCQYARIERISDVTLGDSWGSSLPLNEQMKGISLVLCQSSKGQKLIDESDLELLEVDIEKAIKGNHQLKEPSPKPQKREYFLKQIEKGRKFNWIVWSCYPWISFKQFIKAILIKTKIIGGADYNVPISVDTFES